MRSEKKYKTIYADPPWLESGGGKIKRGADRHYDLMKTIDICNLPVSEISDKNCWLFMWVTNNFLKDGIAVMESWGFRYVTNFVWVKESFGLGYYFRGQHELCLFGVKGNLKPKLRNVRSVLWAEKTKHSRKPPQARQMIKDMAHEPMIELFAREKTDGWDVWGNEVSNSI
jgi:N6-adenosine-specific RNA methylase IME4